MSSLLKIARAANRMGLGPLVARAASMAYRDSNFAVDGEGRWLNRQPEATFVSPTLHTTLYANDFSAGEAGPWTHSGIGFWNVSSTSPRVYSQSSIAGDARASIGVPTGDQTVRVRGRPRRSR